MTKSSTDMPYSVESVPAFLSTDGRILISLLNNPNIKMSELANFLGISIPATHKGILRLVDSGFVSRRRVSTSYSYLLNLDKVQNHPDILAFTQFLTKLTQ